jgi:hypothetical protein
MSKQQNNIANFTERFAARKNTKQFMRTIFGSAIAVLLALSFSLTQSSAEETQSGDAPLSGDGY